MMDLPYLWLQPLIPEGKVRMSTISRNNSIEFNSYCADGKGPHVGFGSRKATSTSGPSEQYVALYLQGSVGLGLGGRPSTVVRTVNDIAWDNTTCASSS